MRRLFFFFFFFFFLRKIFHSILIVLIAGTARKNMGRENGEKYDGPGKYFILDGIKIILV